jgi:hypothetical protein
MRSVVAFMACTGLIVWAHSCDTRIVGVKTYDNEPSMPIYEEEVSAPDLVQVGPVFYAANIRRTFYLDTVNVYPN